MSLPTPHLAVPVRVEGGVPEEFVEGHRVTLPPVPVPEEAFGCSLFLPSPSEDEGSSRRRKVRRPQLLFLPADDGGVRVSAEDQLDVLAVELTGPDPVRWKVTGDPQPAGRPGAVPRAVVAYLVRVED